MSGRPENQALHHAHPGGMAIHHESFVTGMAAFGLRCASCEEVGAGVGIAEELVGQGMVSADRIWMAQKTTGCAAWVFGDPVEGVLLLVPLSETGERAVREGRFDPGAGVIDHYCRRGDPCFGVYIGVYAGRTRQARGALMRACAACRVSVFGQVPCFARAATEDGARSMATLGFAPAGFGTRDLWVQEAIAGSGRMVA
ncbi:MAG: hypothetical protein WA989_09550 [Henriciella sp.]|uniref:hypothetical protein n=1 Tax=Henriciella sp. TaxID=1968823 RepID=UPI003C78ACFA